MKFSANLSPRTSFKEDTTCGFLGGAMAGFNAGLWLLPNAGIMSPWHTMLLCIASGIVTALLMVRVNRRTKY